MEVDMSESDENKGAAILISFMIGGIVGAGLALLLAPQPGRKTRKQIVGIAEDVRDYTTEYAKKLKEKIA